MQKNCFLTFKWLRCYATYIDDHELKVLKVEKIDNRQTRQTDRDSPCGDADDFVVVA